MLLHGRIAHFKHVIDDAGYCVCCITEPMYPMCVHWSGSSVSSMCIVILNHIYPVCILILNPVYPVYILILNPVFPGWYWGDPGRRSGGIQFGEQTGHRAESR